MSKTPLAPLSIVNGRLVLPDEAEPVPGGIRVLGDRIAEIGSITPVADDRIHDAKGALIAPGLVDLGVFDTNLRRQFAALTLETGGLAMGGTIEVRDSTTGRLLLTTVA